MLQHLCILVLFSLGRGSTTTTFLELAPGAFQQSIASGSTTNLDITALDSRTASYNGAFYSLDELSSAFVQLSTTSTYILAEQLDEVVCFDVDATGFHSLELSGSNFLLVQRYFNGSIASSSITGVSSVVYGLCTLHDGDLHFVSLNNTIHWAQGTIELFSEVLDITEEDGWLLALMYDSNAARFQLYNSSGTITNLSEPQLYDRFLGAEIETPIAIGGVGVGPYPVFDLLYSSQSSVVDSSEHPTTTTRRTVTTEPIETSQPAITSNTLQSSESGVSNQIVLSSFVVSSYITQTLVDVELLTGSSTVFAGNLGTLNIAGSFDVGPGSSLTLDLSNTMVEDGTTLTLFTYSEMNGSFDEILIEGWDQSCESITADSVQNSSEMHITFSVTTNEACFNDGASLLTTVVPMICSLL